LCFWRLCVGVGRPERWSLISKPVAAGGNDAGQLGLGNTDNRGHYDGSVKLGAGRTILRMFSGSSAYTTCALLDGNELKCWGASHGHHPSLGESTVY
jgi:hypothetical protein